MHRRILTMMLFVALAAAAGCSRGQEGGQPTGTAGTIPRRSVPTGTAPPVKAAVKPMAETVAASLRTADGRERSYHVYVPSSLPADRSVPLLIAMHGGTGWGQQFEKGSGFDGLAEANQFIVVYPDGINIGPAFPLGRVWNGGECCGPAARDKVDDVEFISQVIDTVSAQAKIDPKRVFAAGHSNGGIMAYRLACELSDKVVAIGLQAGWLAIDSCRPSQPVSALHIHGTADDNAPIDGGRGGKSISGVDARPAIDGVKTLAAVDGCPTDPRQTVAGDLTTDVWTPCRQGTEVQLVRVKGASHAWMGHEANPVSERIVGPAYTGLDASAEIWAFLAAHPRP